MGFQCEERRIVTSSNVDNKFFDELVAEVEPFLSLQKAAKSKSKGT